jgi:hypothetical protein
LSDQLPARKTPAIIEKIDRTCSKEMFAIKLPRDAARNEREVRSTKKVF